MERTQSTLMDLQTLLASIDLSNNGYLFVPTKAELDCARANQGIVDIRNGRIYRCTTPTEYFKVAPIPFVRRDPALDHDWESAILARQCLRDL